MNTSGVQRGYMSKNMKIEEYLNVVIKALSREFEKQFKIENIGDDGVKITVDNYELFTSMKYINELSKPYGIDKFILINLEKGGFNFDRNRSQYIQYCFGVYK